jgi:hypothetical protein
MTAAALLDTARLRSLLIEEIEEAGEITTGELAARMPGKEVVVDVPCDGVCRRKARWSQTQTVLEHQPARHRILAPRTANDVYRHLRALEDTGIITGLRGTEARGVLWVWKGDEFDEPRDLAIGSAVACRPIITPTLRSKEGLL